MPAPQRNLSLRHGFAALEAIARAPQPPSTGELALALGLHKSTCSRLMLTLAEDGYVARIGRGRWRAHLGLMALGAFGLAASPLARSQEALAALIQDTGCLAALGFVWRDQVVYLFHSHEAGAVRGFGNVYPVKDSSIGRLLSAPRRRRALVENADTSFSLAVPVEVGGSRLGLAIAGPDARLTAANEDRLTACARRIEELCHEPERPWNPPDR